MLIGNGLVAKAFGAYAGKDDCVVFASGVSNSKTTNPELYKRETALLKECIEKHNDKSVLYFSTCSIYDPEEKNSAYIRHKLSIEDYITSHANQFYIFRVSNLAGKSDNPNTILNFLFYQVRNGTNFNLWTKACRNIIDVDSVVLIIDFIIRKKIFSNSITNIANPLNHSVREIVAAIEKFLNKKSDFIEIDKGSCFDIDVSRVLPIKKELNISFADDYLNRMLNKYFTNQ